MDFEFDSDEDTTEPFSDSGSEYRPSSGSSLSSSAASSSSSSSMTIDGIVRENVEVEEEFSITNGYILKEIGKKSNHKVWEHFGILFKTNKIVSKTKERFFCRKCFEKSTIKR